jgi:hypothetical protein
MSACQSKASQKKQHDHNDEDDADNTHAAVTVAVPAETAAEATS